MWPSDYHNSDLSDIPPSPSSYLLRMSALNCRSAPRSGCIDKSPSEKFGSATFILIISAKHKSMDCLSSAEYIELPMRSESINDLSMNNSDTSNGKIDCNASLFVIGYDQLVALVFMMKHFSTLVHTGNALASPLVNSITGSTSEYLLTSTKSALACIT